MAVTYWRQGFMPGDVVVCPKGSKASKILPGATFSVCTINHADDDDEGRYHWLKGASGIVGLCPEAMKAFVLEH